MDTMGIVERIRAAVAELHDRIERLPFSAAVMTGRLNRDEYARLLGQLLHAHAALEAELDARPELACVYRRETMARADALRGDLAALGYGGRDTPLHAVAAPMPQARALAESFGRLARAEPWSLLGALYIFEGSRMGSMILYKALSRTLGVPAEPGRGLDYHMDGLPDRPKTWKKFREDLEAVPAGEPARDAIVTAAAETMGHVYRLYEALPVSAMGDAVSAVGAAPGVPGVPVAPPVELFAKARAGNPNAHSGHPHSGHPHAAAVGGRP
jgi:heme oxygenase